MNYEKQIRSSRILVVDDAISTLTLLDNVLNRLGYKHVRCLNESHRFAEVRQEFCPDLIILDLIMPEPDGLQILEIIRQSDNDDAWTPVLILTAESDPAVKRKALAGGATEFMGKPFDPSEMVLRIRNLLLLRILQDQLREQNRALEARVAERTRSLNERTRQLENAVEELKETQRQLVQQERLRAFGEMAGGVAHDFNNVLLCVIGYTDLMMSSPELLQTDTAMEFLRAMNTAGLDASRIVARLREFYRPREESEIFIPIDVNKMLEEVVMLTQPKWNTQALARSRTIEIVFDLQAVPQVHGNPGELREVFINLIFNAADAMPHGGMIILGSSSEGSVVTLTVADTGSGMTEEVRQRCMEPFFSTKGEKGTGLGLAMVFGIIKRHDGEIEIESKPGRGTTFKVSLKTPRPEEIAQVEEDDGPQISLRILLVDDDPIPRDVVTRYLQADGHEVLPVSSGFEAMERMQARTFDLVITDHVMPGITGSDLAATIKNSNPAQPVILLTGYSDPAFDNAHADAGIDRVDKTISRKELQRAIAKAMRPVQSAATSLRHLTTK